MKSFTKVLIVCLILLGGALIAINLIYSHPSDPTEPPPGFEIPDVSKRKSEGNEVPLYDPAKVKKEWHTGK